jgi:hypothetical protein
MTAMEEGRRVTYDNTTKPGDGKASFDDIYDQPDPRAYVAGLSELEYRIPGNARPIFAHLIDLTRQRSGDDLAVLDLCCSYGINAALLNHGLSLDDFYARYTADEVAAMSTEELRKADRAFYAERRQPDAVRMVGLDVAANAIDYAISVGILDAGASEDLEANDPSGTLKKELADVGLVTVTGGIGYITEATFDRVLGAASGDVVPWVAAFALRWVDMSTHVTALERYGLVLEQLQGHTFRQRRFADDSERDFVLGELDRLGMDATGMEAEGYHHTNFYLARRAEEIEATALEDLLAPVL